MVIARPWQTPTTSTHGLMKMNHSLMKIRHGLKRWRWENSRGEMKWAWVNEWCSDGRILNPYLRGEMKLAWVNEGGVKLVFIIYAGCRRNDVGYRKKIYNESTFSMGRDGLGIRWTNGVFGHSKEKEIKEMMYMISGAIAM